MFKSIFERLFWTNVAILIVVFLSISISLTAFVINYTTEKQYETVVNASKSIEYMTVSLQIERSDPISRTIYLNTLNSWAEFVNADITIVNQAGGVFASTNAITQVPDEYNNQVLYGQILKKRGHFGNFYENKVLTVGIPVFYKGNIIGGMYFNTRLPQLNKTVIEILYMFLLSATASIILAFIFIYFQSKRISKPIKQINKAAMDIAAGNFENRMDIMSNDEIGQLASSFNFMADSLERLEQMRSGFVSDVSHELRTPMTSISGFIQGILDNTIPEENQKEYLKIVLDETNRLTRLVNNMLEMSKLANKQYSLDMKKFNLAELIRLAVIQLENKINDKALEVEIDFAVDPIMVIADEDSIRRVIINLLDNAIKFSYNNTKIDIKVWFENNKAYTSIGNFGIGIEKQDLRTVFDRFYKTDKSRSKDNHGAGLGLYLVKNLLLYHKQEIWAQSDEKYDDNNIKYTKFIFTLEKA